MRIEPDDPRFAEWLRRAARAYHDPSSTPREEMWSAIAARQRRHAWLRWGTGIAAILVLGIALGRWTAASGPGEPAAVAAQDTTLAYEVAAAQFLGRSEALLVGFRADSRRGRVHPDFVRQARDLLTTTRLMLDSPVGEDARLRVLLEDLELVLAQIAQLGARRETEELNLITQGLEQRSVLTRLRATITAAPAPVRAGGAL